MELRKEVGKEVQAWQGREGVCGGRICVRMRKVSISIDVKSREGQTIEMCKRCEWVGGLGGVLPSSGGRFVGWFVQWAAAADL